MPDDNQRISRPTDLIEIADRRTERRGKTLDLDSELVMAVQEVCQERRWHWRKKSIRFQTSAGATCLRPVLIRWHGWLDR